jgi:hypothetical protein
MEPPLVLGGMAELVGFAVSKVRDQEPSLDPALVLHLRQEQWARLKNPFTARGVE